MIDLPPGTGDAQTPFWQVRLGSTLVITTPQVAQAMSCAAPPFRQVQVPIVGVVGNMSVVCPECGEEDEIFGRGGGEWWQRLPGAPLLARIPIDVRIREGDRGRPVVLAWTLRRRASTANRASSSPRGSASARRTATKAFRPIWCRC